MRDVQRISEQLGIWFVFFFLHFFGKRIHYSRARTSISSIITAQSQHCRWEWLFITENDTKPQYNGQQQFVVCGVYLVNTIDSIQCYASTVKKICCALICQWYFSRCAHIVREMGFDFIWRKIVLLYLVIDGHYHSYAEIILCGQSMAWFPNLVKRKKK